MEDKKYAIGQLDVSARQDNLIDRTMAFVWSRLKPWQDDPERLFAEGEEELNGQFHDFIDSRARDKFPMVFFRHEQRQTGIRRVDLSAKPVRALLIQGVTYTKYDSILVIEGKRLPAPSKQREREYVIGEEKGSGGIQRFKRGLHGKDHQVAIILVYVQRKTCDYWHVQINSWISELSHLGSDEWAETEKLMNHGENGEKFLKALVSDHPRSGECVSPEIRLFHYWILMPSKKVKDDNL